MNIKGNEYLFGRCLRVAFTRRTINAEGKENETDVFFITHAPDVNRDNYVAMDVSVIDRPSATSKGNPGFQGTVTVYNPSKKLLDTINQGATWVTDYVHKNDTSEEKSNAIRDFYNSRLTCTISAGYLDKDGLPDWHVILKGYVNGSSLARKGVEDVLTFGIMDIDPIKDSMMVDKEITKLYGPEYEIKRVLETQNTNRFEATWHETLLKYIRQWEFDRIPDPKSSYDQNRSIAYATSTQQQQKKFPDRTDFSKMSEEEQPFIPVSDFDRKRYDWFEVKYVSSLSDWLKSKQTAGLDWADTRSGIGPEGVQLEIDLKTQQMPQKGAVYGNNLSQMLDGLCAVANTRVGWYCDKTNTKRNIYIIYPLGAEPLWVKGEDAGIRIWNYQNLLESPSVSGSGIMTVKMLFNPKCVCNITLALMLDRSIISKDDATRNLSNIESGDYGSMATSASLQTFGTVQLGASAAVATVNKEAQEGKSRGYLFNLGFPIIEVKHELSTYGKNWTTTVKTVPMTAGLTFAQSKQVKGEK